MAMIEFVEAGAPAKKEKKGRRERKVAVKAPFDTAPVTEAAVTESSISETPLEGVA